MQNIIEAMRRKWTTDGRINTAREKRELERALRRAGFSFNKAKAAVADVFKNQ